MHGPPRRLPPRPFSNALRRCGARKVSALRPTTRSRAIEDVADKSMHPDEGFPGARPRPVPLRPGVSSMPSRASVKLRQCRAPRPPAKRPDGGRRASRSAPAPPPISEERPRRGWSPRPHRGQPRAVGRSTSPGAKRGRRCVFRQFQAPNHPSGPRRRRPGGAARSDRAADVPARAGHTGRGCHGGNRTEPRGNSALSGSGLRTDAGPAMVLSRLSWVSCVSPLRRFERPRILDCVTHRQLVFARARNRSRLRPGGRRRDSRTSRPTPPTGTVSFDQKR